MCEREGRNIEGMNDGWISHLTFLVAVTGYLYKVNKELHSKGKLLQK